METTQTFLVDWLSRGNPVHKKLLEKCIINLDLETGVLSINSPAFLWDILSEFSQELSWLAPGHLVKSVQLAIDGEVQIDFFPAQAQRYPTLKPVDLFGLELSSQLKINKGTAIAVVEMGSNLGVFCTRQINEISKLPDEAWRDQDMRSYHIPSEYHRFISALEKHQSVSDFEYYALTGMGEKYWQRVNAYLAKLGPRTVRVVEVVDYRVL